MIVQGSSMLYPGLLAAGLIDRLILMTYPVILGSGKRLFGDGTSLSRMALTDHRVTDQGTIIATYAPGGDMPPYPDAAPIPATSERELERRRRIAAGTW